jgi:hypothetical protein
MIKTAHFETVEEFSFVLWSEREVRLAACFTLGTSDERVADCRSLRKLPH